jgi:hypothetical protein
MTTLPSTVGPNGQIIVNQPPTIETGPQQAMTGSPIDAAASKTLTANANQIAAAKSLGAGQKGSSRRRRRHRGGSNMTASIATVPEAGTMKGVSYANNHINAINNLNQLRASGAYDSLTSAPPMQIKGGFRLSDAETMYPGSGTHVYTKRSRKTKKRNGGSNKRTHRRISRKSSTHRSRRRRSHK